MKKYLSYKGFQGSSEISFSDNCLHGKLMFIDDLITYEAETPDRLEEEFQIAVDDYLDTCKELGKNPAKPCSGTFNIRIGPDLHYKLHQAALTEDLSLNELIKKALNKYIDESESREVIHKHFHNHNHVYEYNEKIEIPREMPWKSEPILKLVK